MNPATYFLLLGSTALPSSRIQETNHFLPQPTSFGPVARSLELKPEPAKNELTSSDLSALEAEILELKNQMNEKPSKPSMAPDPLSPMREIRVKSDSYSQTKKNI